MSENANLKATVVFLTYRSVIEDIFKFRVDNLQETFTPLLSVNNHRKLCMTQIIGSECDHSDLLHWKTGGFLSLQITFAQGHLQAHIQEFYILLDFGRKRSQQHIVIHSSSLQGCSVYLFVFFRDPVFIWKNTEPGFL